MSDLYKLIGAGVRKVRFSDRGWFELETRDGRTLLVEWMGGKVTTATCIRTEVRIETVRDGDDDPIED